MVSAVVPKGTFMRSC